MNLKKLQVKYFASKCILPRWGESVDRTNNMPITMQEDRKVGLIRRLKRGKDLAVPSKSLFLRQGLIPIK